MDSDVGMGVNVCLLPLMSGVKEGTETIVESRVVVEYERILSSTPSSSGADP